MEWFAYAISAGGRVDQSIMVEDHGTYYAGWLRMI